MTEPQTIEIKLNWRNMWRTLVELYVNSDPVGSAEATRELRNMATGADRWSAIVKYAEENAIGVPGVMLNGILEQIAQEVPERG